MDNRLLLAIFIFVVSLSCARNKTELDSFNSSLLDEIENGKNFDDEILKVVELGTVDLFSFCDSRIRVDSLNANANLLPLFDSDLKQLMIDRSNFFTHLIGNSTTDYSIDSIRFNKSKFPDITSQAYLSFSDSTKIVERFPNGMVIHVRLDTTAKRTKENPFRFKIKNFNIGKI